MVTRQLSSNNALVSLRDSPAASFVNVLRGITQAKTDTDRASLLRTVHTEMQTEVKDLLLKHRDVTELSVLIFASARLGAGIYRPAQLLVLKETAWAFIYPFLVGGFHQLLFLVCKAPEMNCARLLALDADAANAEIAAFMRDHHRKDRHVFDLVAFEEVVRLADSAYGEHLAKVFASGFASEKSEKWNAGYVNYLSQFDRDLQLLGEDEGSVSMDEVHMKLKAVFGKRTLINAFPFVPRVEGGTPALCVGSMKGLFEVFTALKPAITLVRSFSLTDTSTGLTI